MAYLVSEVSSSSSPSSSSSSPSVTEYFGFDAKKAPDGTPVPHSSIGISFGKGSRVDPMDGRGTVKPEGDSSGICCAGNDVQVDLILYQPLILAYLFINSLLKFLPMSRLPRDFLLLPVAASAFTLTT